MCLLGAGSAVDHITVPRLRANPAEDSMETLENGQSDLQRTALTMPRSRPNGMIAVLRDCSALTDGKHGSRPAAGTAVLLARVELA